MYVPGTRIGLLSHPSKMPSKSFGITAIASCPSATFGPGAICGESKDVPTCYAMRGAYAWAPVRRAYAARFDYVKRAAQDAEIGHEFVALMVQAIDKEAARQERRHWREVSKGHREFSEFEGPVFRVHDSGDLFSPAYTLLWARVATLCSDVRFWFPTRQWKSRNLDMLAALQALGSLPNVAVRPSALYFEDDAPIVLGLAAGTTASTNGYTCPASSQKNACLDCRACWTKDVVVSYHKH